MSQLPLANGAIGRKRTYQTCITHRDCLKEETVG